MQMLLVITIKLWVNFFLTDRDFKYKKNPQDSQVFFHFSVTIDIR